MLAPLTGLATTQVSITKGVLEIDHTTPADAPAAHTIFVAVHTGFEPGSAVLPFEEKTEGSTMFLPFRAQRLYAVEGDRKSKRTWSDWKWSDRSDAGELEAKIDGPRSVLRLPLKELKGTGPYRVVVYTKSFANKPWGELISSSDAAVAPGEGDKYIPHYLEVAEGKPAERKGRFTSPAGRPRIYQLLVRLFSNTNERRKPNGTLEENGTGKFGDINEAALQSLQGMGFTHIWLTGVVQQATGTDYSQIGQPADDPDLLKGVAGSPYAIKDYFDVSPDYATDPKNRVAEFQQLLERMRKHQLRALIDFVPNHVARSYNSDVKPEHNFGTRGRGGKGDDVKAFFEPQNNFFYLRPGKDGPPLRLPTIANGQPVSPTCQVEGMQCDGLFEPETEHGRVTGNNVNSWRPSLGDWYETVKLNFGFDFTDRTRREYPNATAPQKPIPDTWKKMDAVLAYWQELGVDGFRCDMAHMVPPEFWDWAITRARQRKPDVLFVAEAYDNDPAKVGGLHPVLSKLKQQNVMIDLLNAGFDAVYDDPSYKALKAVYDGDGWANNVDGAVPDEYVFDNSLRYAENHDEVRLAAKGVWGRAGARVGMPVSAILYGVGRGPAMLYNGQEVGEPARGIEGFGGDDQRTSIFDYWSMPELVKWVNGHAYDGGKLDDAQKQLRSFYDRLLKLVGEPAFRDGRFMSLQQANKENPRYGRVQEEKQSGRWIYSFLRYDPATEQRFLVVVNLHPRMTLKDVAVQLPKEALQFLGLTSDAKLTLTERLGATAWPDLQLSANSVTIGDMRPLTPLYFELKR
jgi:glycosidase